MLSSFIQKKKRLLSGGELAESCKSLFSVIVSLPLNNKVLSSGVKSTLEICDVTPS